jgi:PPOX class probable F420-dependent enzyme
MTDTLRQDAIAERLATEEIAWLTTVTGKGQPQSSPIWFLWDGESFWLRSQEHAAKVRNIGGNPRVSLHLSDDGHGGNVVTVDSPKHRTASSSATSTSTRRVSRGCR